MSVITEAVYDVLRNDPLLVGTFTNGVPNRDGLISWIDRWGSYWDPAQSKWVSNAIPAIFPVDLDLTEITTHHANFRDLTGFIVTTGHAADSFVQGYGKTKKARNITKTIRCCYRHPVTAAASDGQQAEDMAERVFEIFHQKPLVIPAPSDLTHYTRWEAVMVTCSGPVHDPEKQVKSKTHKIDVVEVHLDITIQECP